MFKTIPSPPDKGRILELTSKTHCKDIPNWTTAEASEMFEALRLVSFYWYRDEKFIR